MTLLGVMEPPVKYHPSIVQSLTPIRTMGEQCLAGSFGGALSS